MRAVRIFTGNDNESHFEELEIPLETLPGDSNVTGHGITHGRTSVPLPVTHLIFQELPAGLEIAPHAAGGRRWLLILSGRMEIFCRDGSSVTLGPLDLFLANDDSGGGHGVRTLEPVRGVLIPTAPDFDPSSFRRMAEA